MKRRFSTKLVSLKAKKKKKKEKENKKCLSEVLETRAIPRSFDHSRSKEKPQEGKERGRVRAIEEGADAAVRVTGDSICTIEASLRLGKRQNGSASRRRMALVGAPI